MISTLVHNSFLDWDTRKLMWALCSILKATKPCYWCICFLFLAMFLYSLIFIFLPLYFFILEADLKSFLKECGVQIKFNWNHT